MKVNLKHARIYTMGRRNGCDYDIYMDLSGHPEYLMSYSGDTSMCRRLERGLSLKKFFRCIQNQDEKSDLIKLQNVISCYLDDHKYDSGGATTCRNMNFKKRKNTLLCMEDSVS